MAYLIHEDELLDESWDDRPASTLSWRTLTGANPAAADEITSGVATFPPATGRLERHRHPHAEVYFVLQGTANVHVNEETFQLRKGSCLHIPANAWHEVENTGADSFEIFYCFASNNFHEIVYEYAADNSPRNIFAADN